MKKILLPLLVFVVAVSLSAFTHFKPSLIMQGWFIYTGDNPNDPNSYTFSTEDPGCSANSSLCAVFADIDPSTTGGGLQNSKPIATGSSRSLSVLSSESQGFTQATDDVELHN
jgi:hypothetical protein